MKIKYNAEKWDTNQFVAHFVFLRFCVKSSKAIKQYNTLATKTLNKPTENNDTNYIEEINDNSICL